MMKTMVVGKKIDGVTQLTQQMVMSGDRIVLVDASTGQPPKKITTKMVNKDLHIFADGATDPSVILNEYASYDQTVQISGIDSSGAFANYSTTQAGAMELGAVSVAPVAAPTPVMSTSAWWGVGILAVAGGVAAAAGGGGGGGSTTTVPAATTLTANLVDSLVQGVSYTTSSGLTGVTGITLADGSLGSFAYKAGDTVTFKVGQATIGTFNTANINADHIVTIQEIAGVLRTNTTDTKVVNIAQFLQSLDSDGNAANGITIAPATAALITTVIDVQTALDPALQTALTPTGVTLVTEVAATAHLNAVVADTTSPTATIALSDSLLNSGETATVTITFSEAVAGFSNADITVQNGTVSTFVSADGGITWTAVFTPTAGISLDVSNVINLASTYIDGAGNAGTSAQSANYTVNTATTPPPAPTLTISDDEPSTTANIAGGSIAYTFTFGDTVTGFTADDITVTGGGKGAFSGSGITYALVVTPTAGYEGNVAVSVAAGAALGTGSAQSLAANSSQLVDMLAPTALTLDLLPANDTGLDNTDNITSSSAMTVSGIEAGATWEYSLDGGTWTSGSATTFNLSNNTAYSIGAIQVRQSDAAGNVSIATSNTEAITTDTTGPKLTITNNQGDVTANMDGSNGDATSKADGADILYTFKFDEVVKDFTAGDIVVTHGTAKTFTASPDGMTYTLGVTPEVGYEGNMTIGVLSSVYHDVAGNVGNIASDTSSVQVVDMLAPLLMDTTFDGVNDWIYDYVNKTISFTLNSSLEAVNMSDPGGFDVYINTHLIPVQAVSMLGDTVTLIMPKAIADDFTNLESVRVVYKDVTTDLTPAIQDLAGNDATSFTYIKPDVTPPTVTQIFFNNPNLSIGQSSLVTITFSEEVRDLLVHFNNGTLSALASTADARVWTATFTASANVEFTSNVFSVGAGDYHDLNGLAGTTTTPYTYYVDTRAPTIAISDDEAAAVANIVGGNLTYTFTFSEPVTDFTLQDITIVGGTPAGALTTVSTSVYTLDITPTAGVKGNVTVDVAAGAVTDFYGNPSTVALQSIQAVDMKAPTVVISMNDAVVTAGDAPIVTFTFSEAVLGFDGSDLNLSSANGTINNLFSGDGGVTYTGTFAPTAGIAADVLNTITLAGVYTDVAGNTGVGGSTGNYIVETKAPLITAPVADVVGHTSTGTIDITFNSLLDEGMYAPNSMFYVTDGTLTPDLTDGAALLKFVATAVSVLGNNVTLSIDPSITDTPSATWIVTYTDNPGNDAQALQSIYGSDVSSFTHSINTVI
ncbi:MAG: Ig-like domain-containing protein [Pseudomonadota bacterium]